MLFRSAGKRGDQFIASEMFLLALADAKSDIGGVVRGHGLTRKALEAAITPRSKVLMLSFPTNPTGGTMTRAQLEEVAALLAQPSPDAAEDSVTSIRIDRVPISTTATTIGAS